MAGLTAINRKGFFQGALADAEEGKAMSPGTSAQGGSSSAGYGRDNSEKATREDLKISSFVDPKQKARGTGPLKSNLKPSYYQNFKNKVYQNSLKRNRVLAMRKMNLMQGRNPFSKEIPDWAEDYTQENLMNIATSGPYLGQQKTVGDVSKFSEGKDLLGRVTEGQSILDREGMTQTEWQNERLFPNVIEGNGDGSGTGYRGYPSYESWLAAQSGAGTGEDVVEDETIEYHLGKGGPQTARDVTDPRGYAANGGIMELRARRAFGGIMDRVTGRRAYGLGSIFKSVKKAVGKVLKSDVGKIALMAAGAYYMPGVGAKAAGGWGKMFSNAGSGIMNLGTNMFTGDNSMFSKLPEKATFADKAIKYAKWGIPGYLLSKTKLGEAKPNEVSYMGDRANNKFIDPLKGGKSDPAKMTATLNEALADAGGDPDKIAAINEAYRFLNDPRLGDDGAKSVLAANGGRIGYANAGKVDHEEDPLYINPDISYEDFPLTQFERDLRYMSKEERKEQLKLLKSVLKQRGNIGADLGMEGGEKTGIERQMELINFGTNIPDKDTGYKDNYSMKHRAAEYLNRDYFNENYETGEHYNQGGRISRAEGGLMDLGGMEKDYRAEGGFVPLGEYEKKDDVPARLSVNEFVFTADAVRGAGDGDIDKGAEIMENMMKNLEKGGTVSEESQGNTGAQQMFNISERLGEVV